MKRRMILNVRGKREKWSFVFEGDARYLEEWRSDGLEIDMLEYVIPTWVASLGSPAIRVYLWLDKIINFRWLS